MDDDAEAVGALWIPHNSRLGLTMINSMLLLQKGGQWHYVQVKV